MKHRLSGLVLLLLLLAGCQQAVIEPGVSLKLLNAQNSYQVNQQISFSGKIVTDAGKTLSDAELKWELRVYDANGSYVLGPDIKSSGGKGSFSAPDMGDDVEKLELCLFAEGLEGNCVSLLPEKVTYSFESEPKGLMLGFEGNTVITGFEKTLVVGSTRTLLAPLQQNDFNFLGWEDGGLTTRELIVGSEPRAFKALYEQIEVDIPCGSLVQEAELGRIMGDFKVFEDNNGTSNASNAKYLGSDVESDIDFTENPDAAHRADFCVTVDQAGTYQVKAWVAGEDAGDDSFIVQVDNGEAYTYSFADITKENNPFPNFTEDYMRGVLIAEGAPLEFTLDEGEHSLVVYLREDGAFLDKFEFELVAAP